MLNSNNVGAFHETSTKVKLDTFKLEDEKNYEDEIGLKVIFAYFRKKTPITFLSEKLTRSYLLREVKPCPDHKRKKIMYLITCFLHFDILAETRRS